DLSNSHFPLYNDQGSAEAAVEAGQETTPTSSGSGAAFGLFSTDFKKNEDLKEMLESNKESLKLEAMKRIVGLISKGKNASELFPAVVKNVASKNIELKKLVYVYLVRYAEEQQDLALLSISTFQRALKKEQLIEVIEKLLKDKSTLVAGSVVVAFEEVCPDRIDLIHKNFRKLCNLLVDVEEWGQVVIINMLTRYARTQFTSPWREDAMFDENNEKAFYDSDSEEKKGQADVKTYIMDPDHRLLLRNTKPLLQSRNTAVVMAVAQLYWHLAPKHEVSIVTKSLVRLLRSHRYIVVAFKHCYNLLSKQGMFEPYMKSFYVRSTDSTHIKTLKLEILTNLANEANISTILREFQTYVKSQDKAFAAATIQAIGRCATNISEVTDTCLNGLVLLLSNRDESVVAESVVVIKKLLQTQPNQHSDIISHMAKLFDNITVPMARASILWLMGEYCERVPKIAPDVLRKMAKTFTVEEDIVKLQTVNLAAKLFLTNSKQTKLLTQYILNLGKYDQNYDIRDRTRFIRQLIVPSEKSSTLNKYARRILLASKPAPVLESAFKDRDRFQLGTLSHSLNIKTSGYQELSEWPAVAPDPSVRNVEVIEPVKFLLKSALFQLQVSFTEKPSYSCSFGNATRKTQVVKMLVCSTLLLRPTPPPPPLICSPFTASFPTLHTALLSFTFSSPFIFPFSERLEPRASVTVSMGIDFSDSTQAANFQLCTKEDQFSVSIQPAVGELLMPSTMTEADFCKEQKKLLGMNETSATITMTTANTSSQTINKQVLSVANVGVAPSSQNNFHRFAGRTVSSGALVLVSLELKESSSALLTINTEKSIMASMLLQDLKQALTEA
uniref:Adaptor related protein complex 3 subunit beta 1 n=1 Tax=Nothobranchius furzeri TaxID=105023 RepID=A0A8C6KQ82_NOTFU